MGTISGEAKVNGVPTDGLLVMAYATSRFSSPPSLNTPLPGTPDSGPVTSGEVYGGPGAYSLSITDNQSYYIACVQDLLNVNVAWEGPRLPEPHTSVQGWTNASDVTSSRLIIPLMGLAGAMDGLSLPQSTITVVTMPGGIPTSGSLAIRRADLSAYTVVTYTGVSGTSFTGCSGGTGTLATGGLVYFAYTNGGLRRLIYATIQMSTSVNGDTDDVVAISQVGGKVVFPARAHVQQRSSTGITQYAPLSMPADPGGVYGIASNNSGSLPVTALNSWLEVDF